MHTSPIVTGKVDILKLKWRVFSQLFRLLYQKTGSLRGTWFLLRQMLTRYQKVLGEKLLAKAAKVDGKYYWRLSTPGFPSEATTRLHRFEINRLCHEEEVGLRTLLFAITKKCPLHCEHCFEWDNLHKEEVLSKSDIIEIVRKFQDYGTTQIMFSGGEPMLRINDIYDVLQSSKPGTDFWIITSGLGLTSEKARMLKEHGLSGVMVSLDHFDPLQHNSFRGSENAFENARNAVLHARQAGLVTTLSLCSTRSFTTGDHLDTYMELAKDWGVTFVQLIEPRAKGKYAGKDVLLSRQATEILDQCYLDYNTLPKYKDFPMVNYLGYHQRKVGCFGAGDRFFYIDTDGFAHICPYCDGKVCNVKDYTAKEVIQLLSRHACHSFAQNIPFVKKTG